MSFAKITEITASSTTSFEAAVAEGIKRASKTIKNIRSAWVKDQEVSVKDDKIDAYRVTLKNNIRVRRLVPNADMVIVINK